MSDDIPKDPRVILCDMCTEEDRKPARKTCMKCEISMCVQHLQTHLTTPVLLQTHPLTEPMSLCGTKCPQHGKLLEYYCLDDMTCVCVSCAIEDQHRLHNMKTFPTAHKDLLEKLNAEQQDLLVKSDDENVSLEKWEKSEREKLGRGSVRLIEAVTSLRDVAMTSVQSSVSARMVAIKTSKSSIQAAQSEKDTFRFLQMYSQVHEDVEKAKAVDLRRGLEPGSDRDKLVKEIRGNGEKMLKQAGHFWGSLLNLVDPENHQELVASPDLMFELQTFGSAMSLSKDKRKVFYNSWLGKCSATLLIQSTGSVPNFQSWTVSFFQDSDWTIGVCDKQYAKTLNDGLVYGLQCQDDQLSTLMTVHQSASVNPQGSKKQKSQVITSELITTNIPNVPRSETVEVFWNFIDSKLSFFRRTGRYQREEIITIEESLNKQDLVPFAQIQKKDEKQALQQQLKCTCGNVYNKESNGYYDYNWRLLQQGICRCGARISDLNTTEVCELI